MHCLSTRAVAGAVFLTTMLGLRLSGGAAQSGDLPLKVEVSAARSEAYLYGEEVVLTIAVTNCGSAPVGYVRGGGNLPMGLRLSISCEGKDFVPQDGHSGNPWGDVADGVARLEEGSVLKERISLTYAYGVLPVGRYAIGLRLDQPPWPGVTRGTAVSNPVEFTVKDWRAAAAVGKTIECRRPDGQVIGATTVQLARTTEGELLVTWKTTFSGATSVDFRAVRLPPNLQISEGLWHASEKNCYIASPPDDRGRRKLVVVDRPSSSVTELELRQSSPVPVVHHSRPATKE